MNLQLLQREPQEVIEDSKDFLKLFGKSHCWVDTWAFSHGKGIPLINSCLNWSTDFQSQYQLISPGLTACSCEKS